MRVAHGLNKGEFNHGCFFLVFAVLVITGSCGGLQPKTITEQQPSVKVQTKAANLNPSPIAIFPLQNDTGQSDLDWLSIALQESITEDLLCISELNTRTLADLNQLVSKKCPGMRISCVAGLNAGEEAGQGPLTLSDWNDMATASGLSQFLWGKYRQNGQQMEVQLALYAGPQWTKAADMRAQAAMGGLLQATSAQLVTFLQSRGIPIKSGESTRILASGTQSADAWANNAMGYWIQQLYLDAGKGEKKTIAAQGESYLRKAIELDPRYAEAWANLGNGMILSGDLNGAAAAFQKALALKPDLITAQLGYGYCLAERGDPAEAAVYLAGAVKLNPSLSRYHDYLMTTYRRAGLFKEGLAMVNMLEPFLKERNREKERMDLVWWRGLFLQELKQYAASKEAYTELLSFKERTVGPEHPEVAVILSNLAFVCQSLGEYTSAEQFLKRALAIDEAAYGRENPQVAVRLTNLALLYHTLGKYQQAQPLYERALAIDEKAYGRDHAEVARDLNNLAKLYYDTGDYAKAKSLYERALAIYEKTDGPEHPHVATVLNNLALLYQTAGKYDAALSLYKRSLAINEKVYGQNHPAGARDISNLASLYYAMGAFDKAKPLYERALAIDEAAYGREHPEVARDLGNLAGVHYALGKYAKAKLLYERALAIDETAYGGEHPEVARDLNNAASVYRALGSMEKARSLYDQSLRISRKVHGQDHPAVAIVLNNLGEICRERGDYAEAQSFYDEALRIYQKVYGPDHPDVATVLNNLAGLSFAAGDYTKARSLYEKALAIDERIYGEEQPSLPVRLNNLAEIYAATGQYDQAEQFYERALAEAQIAARPEMLWRIQFNLGYLLAKRKNPAAAIFFGKQAVNSIQSIRADIATIEKELQGSFLQTKWYAYKFLADLLIDYGRLPEAQQVLDMQKEEEYFDFILRDAGRKDVRTTTAGYNADEAMWSERYGEISKRIAALGREFADLKQKKKFGLSDAELKRYLAISEDLKVARLGFNSNLSALLIDLSKVSMEWAAEVKVTRLDKPRKLQQALEELGHGAVVIYYLITENKLHIILTTTEVQLARDVEIPSKELNRKIMDFRTTLQNPQQSTLPQAQELYKIVIGPIEQDLAQAGAQTLMLSLDGALRYLPAAALHDGQSFLIERYQVALYSAAAGIDIKDKPAGRWMVGGFGLTHAMANLDPLPYVSDELEGIVRRDVSDKDGVLPGVIYLDKAFSEEAMESVLIQGYPVVHIASHFELNPGTEEDSHLVLGNGSTLTLGKIKEDNYDFGGVEMLTLSACNTAVGGVEGNGSEVESLGSLAQDQGAKGVLATLWPVADRSTGVLMQNFYRMHVDKPGMTKAEALRQAQLAFIRGEVKGNPSDGQTRGMRVSKVKDAKGDAVLFNPDEKSPYSHPFFWAPFILMGNWL
jgi:CHAT domain-containing protein/tetratricopeptide (TPR) repeat protein